MTEDVFTVGERAEVKVTILYESEHFEISVTISNISDETIVFYPKLFIYDTVVLFKNSSGKKSRHTKTMTIFWEGVEISPNTLIFLEPSESKIYAYTHEYYLNDSLGKTITYETGEVHIDKEDDFNCVVRFFQTDSEIEEIQALTDAYILEPFEKTYLLELEF